MRYRSQYLKYVWRHSCLSLRMYHVGSSTKSSTCSNKTKMLKSTTGCRIKNFIPTENMNFEKLRAGKINPNKFSQVCLKWIQKVNLCADPCRWHKCFLFYNNFCKLLIITKDNLNEWISRCYRGRSLPDPSQKVRL